MKRRVVHLWLGVRTACYLGAMGRETTRYPAEATCGNCKRWIAANL